MFVGRPLGLALETDTAPHFRVYIIVAVFVLLPYLYCLSPPPVCKFHISDVLVTLVFCLLSQCLAYCGWEGMLTGGV